MSFLLFEMHHHYNAQPLNLFHDFTCNELSIPLCWPTFASWIEHVIVISCTQHLSRNPTFRSHSSTLPTSSSLHATLLYVLLLYFVPHTLFRAFLVLFYICHHTPPSHFSSAASSLLTRKSLLFEMYSSPAFISPTPVPLSNYKSSPSSTISPRHVPRATITKTKTSSPSVPVVDVFSHYRPRSTHRTHPIPPVLIVPGFGADASEYYPMADHLRSHLSHDTFVHVVPITKATWLSTLGGRPVTNVLQLIDDAVQHALQHTGSSNVSIVAHSAGGWISRIYLGDRPYPDPNQGRAWQGNRFVSTLLCLGTPHRSDEKVTVNNMAFVNDSYPGAFHDHVKYVNFVGDGGSVDDVNGTWWRFWEKDWFQRMSYRLTNNQLTQGPVAGDGIVPISVAFLEDAHHNVCLKGVWHSSAPGRPWYGHPRVVEYWSTFLR